MMILGHSINSKQNKETQNGVQAGLNGMEWKDVQSDEMSILLFV